MVEKHRRKRDQVFTDNTMGGADTGLVHGLTKAETRADTGQAFYDSNYDTTEMANRRLPAYSATESADDTFQTESMGESLDNKLYENDWSITKALRASE